eukprot:CAMPEP_0175998630 /NCGR_PEP_ID=MMETSP0108-20121206/56855_1 /TAXON_ID=195067 ORGANISM="Goniomonas pacifica, Strain CCMP1869" /NCGR_SAMPLE_ID=MMETSP0108 /ASSEMBLY_ACC=CAM_ASM_000204 /LENGTH=227 /DNA_ID=CAMNT_0017331007 /DNA_START=54 /DNA_END=737 /DNA_ORIENTATION=-
MVVAAPWNPDAAGAAEGKRRECQDSVASSTMNSVARSAAKDTPCLSRGIGSCLRAFASGPSTAVDLPEPVPVLALCRAQFVAKVSLFLESRHAPGEGAQDGEKCGEALGQSAGDKEESGPLVGSATGQYEMGEELNSVSFDWRENQLRECLGRLEGTPWQGGYRVEDPNALLILGEAGQGVLHYRVARASSVVLGELLVAESVEGLLAHQGRLGMGLAFLSKRLLDT